MSAKRFNHFMAFWTQWQKFHATKKTSSAKAQRARKLLRVAAAGRA